MIPLSLRIRRVVSVIQSVLFLGGFAAGASAQDGSYPCAPLADRAVLWLRGEGSFEDATGLQSVSFEGGAAYGDGIAGQALAFDGTREVMVADSPALNGDTFTIEAWVRPERVDGVVDILANKEAGPHFHQFQYELGIKGPLDDVPGTIPEGNLAFFLGGVAGLPDDHGGWVDGRVRVPMGTWSHVALAVAPGRVSVYLNGLLTRRLDDLGGRVRVTTGPLRLGSRDPAFVSVRPQERFDGLMDEFTFHARELEADEIRSIHAAGSLGKCFPEVLPVVNSPDLADVPIASVHPFPGLTVGRSFRVEAGVLGSDGIPATGSMLVLVEPGAGLEFDGFEAGSGTETNLAGLPGVIVGGLGPGDPVKVVFRARCTAPVAEVRLTARRVGDDRIGARRPFVFAAAADADGDGVADAWEEFFRLDPADAADAGLDLDGDGATSREEFEMGTHPNLRRDVLGASWVRGDDGRIRFRTATVAGRWYRWETAAQPWGPWWVVGDWMPGDGTSLELALDRVTDPGTYYRLRGFNPR